MQNEVACDVQEISLNDSLAGSAVLHCSTTSELEATVFFLIFDMQEQPAEYHQAAQQVGSGFPQDNHPKAIIRSLS